MSGDTTLVRFVLRRTGAALLFCAEPAASGPHAFAVHGVHGQRMLYESEALAALRDGGVGSWSSFPPEGVQATVTRDQLRRMRFRGNY